MLAVVGLIIALISTLVLIDRVDSAINRNDALDPSSRRSSVARPDDRPRLHDGDRLGRLTGWTAVRAAALAGLGIVLSLLMIRTTGELNFYRINTGEERWPRR